MNIKTKEVPLSASNFYFCKLRNIKNIFILLNREFCAWQNSIVDLRKH